MAEIINPEFIQTELKPYTKKWQLKYGYPIVITFLCIVLGIVIYMIYQDYYEPNFKMIDFLPEEYVLAIEYNKNDDSLSKIQSLELLNQPTFQKIYLKTSDQINSYINSWPLNIQSAIKQSKESVLFLDNGGNYGLIVKLDSKKQAEKIKDIPNPKNNFFKIVQQEILIITNNEETLEQTIKTKTKPVSAYNLEVSLTPWLNIYFDNNFFIHSFSDPLITNFQTILKPLSLNGEQQYTLQLINKSHQVIISLIPKIKNLNENEIALDNYLNYLPVDSEISFGINNLKSLADQLDTNIDLKNYFNQTDFITWVKNQLSISTLIKNFQGPIIISKSDNYWNVLTNTSNREAVDGLIKNYIAQFSPITQKIVLPDGTLGTELIADPKQIIWNVAEKDGWQLFSYSHPKQNSLLGYAVKDEKIIISNKIDSFGNFSSPKNCILPNIKTFIKINPKNNKLLTFDFLIQNFANISAISTNTGQIKLCLDLK